MTKLKKITRHSEIAVVRRLFKMGPKMVQRRLKSLRRLFHSLPAEIWSMLKKSATLIAFLPRHEVVDAYSARRQLHSDEYRRISITERVVFFRGEYFLVSFQTICSFFGIYRMWVSLHFL